jgi:hypothetical protein
MKAGVICVFTKDDWVYSLDDLFDENIAWPESIHMRPGDLVMFLKNFNHDKRRLCIVKIPGLKGEWAVDTMCIAALKSE